MGLCIYYHKTVSYVSVIQSFFRVCNAFLVASNAVTADLCLLVLKVSPRSCTVAYVRCSTVWAISPTIYSVNTHAAASVCIAGSPWYEKASILPSGSIFTYTIIKSPHTVFSCLYCIVASSIGSNPTGSREYAVMRSFVCIKVWYAFLLKMQIKDPNYFLLIICYFSY